MRERDSFKTMFTPTAEITPQERKWKDTPDTVAGQEMILNRTLLSRVLLNGLTLGSDAKGQRTGRVIRTRNIQITGIVEARIDSEGVADPALISLWLVYDKQTNGATFGGGQAQDFLAQGVNLVTAPGDSPSSQFLNLNYRDRFVILKHELFVIGPHEKEAGQQGFTGSPYPHLVRWNLDVDLETIYNNGNAGNAADIRTGSIVFCGCADIAAKTGLLIADYRCLFHARIRYTDG